MTGKYGLVIGNTQYTDPGLAKLTAPGKDAKAFARVLQAPNICGFDKVQVLLDQPEPVVREAIDAFFTEKKPDDLLVLYFSGHGIRDEYGSLYLAVRNTNRLRLRATAIKSDFIRESMDQSRSRRQVLILDCCNSGAFAQGTKAATGVSIGTASAFEGTGYGRVVLTASDATQFAWEGEQIIGQVENSLFTHFLVKGLEGEADQDGDGRITIDELYDYAYGEIVNVTPKQTPGKWSYKQQGEIILRQSTRPEDIKPVALPQDLLDEVEDTRPYVREAAVQKLAKILQGRNIGLARSAQAALERIIADENTTRRVGEAATQALEAYRQAQNKTLSAGTRDVDKQLPGQMSEARQREMEQAGAKLRAREVTEQLAARDVRKALRSGTGLPALGPRWRIAGIAGIVIVAIAVLGYAGITFLLPALAPGGNSGGATPTAESSAPTAEAPYVEKVPPIILQADGGVNSVAFSADSRYLAAAGQTDTITIWDLTTHQPIDQPPLQGHTDVIRSLAFSGDGNWLASGSNDGSVILWNVKSQPITGNPLKGHAGPVTCIAFVPGQNTLVSGSTDKTLILWDLQTQKQGLKLRTAPVDSLAFAPDGNSAASGGNDGIITLWRYDRNRQVPVQDTTVDAKGGDVLTVAYSPDGKTLAFASTISHNISLWDISSQKQIGQPLQGHSNVVTSLYFSPDGTLLASGSDDHTVILWDVRKQKAIGTPLQGHTDKVFSVAFSPDGKTLASGGADKTIILWDVASVVQAAAVSEWPRNQALSVHTADVNSVAFSPDGSKLASGSKDKSIILWDMATRKAIGGPMTGHTGGVSSVAFSPDGQMLASGSNDNTIILWDTTTRLAIGPPLTGHKDAVTSVAFSPDGKTLASGSRDQAVRLWNVGTRQEIGQPLAWHSGAVDSVAFSPDGTMLASAGDDKTIILWDVATQRPIGQPLRQHTDIVRMVAFSPDGKTLASASEDKTVILWDVATQKPVGDPLTGATDQVSSVAFSPNGTVLAAGSLDSTVILWDLEKRRPIGQPLNGNTNSVYDVAFSPDGSTLASATIDNVVMLWNMSLVLGEAGITP